MDLQDEVRMDDTYYQLESIIKDINNINAFPQMSWLYTWDVVAQHLYSYDESALEDYVVNPKLNKKSVFNMLWEDADKMGFTLEYGIDSLTNSIFDWMLDKDIIIDRDSLDVVESEKQ